MSRLYAGVLVVLALASAAPAQALWGGQAKKLPEPARFRDGREEVVLGRLSVLRPGPRRLQGQNWGRGQLKMSPRGLSMPHLQNY